MPDPTPADPPSRAALTRQLQRLQAAVYAQTDPSADAALRAELARVQTALRDAAAVVPRPDAPPAPLPPRPPAGRLLGPETTGLKVEPTLNLNPVPTAIYPLLDPDTDPLLTVAVTNVSL